MSRIDPSTSLRSVIMMQRRHQHPNTDALLFLMDRGADPTAPNEAGVSILEDLCDHQSPSRYAGNARSLMLCALIKKGANPLLHPDRFIGMFNYSTGIGNAMIRAMHDRETHAPCRDTSNRNPLHLLMHAYNSWRETRQHLQQIGQSPIYPGWMTQPDDEGQTPVHYLWSARHYRQEDARIIWSLTQTLWETGADFFCRDLRGDRPVDLVLRALRNGFPSPEESCAYVAPLLATLKAENIHRCTPPVSRSWALPRL
jgi:hypothetical protein